MIAICVCCENFTKKTAQRQALGRFGSSFEEMAGAVALLDGIFTRIGLSFLLGVVLAWGIQGFWYGNALSGLVPFLIGTVYLISGTWKKTGGRRREEAKDLAD